MDYTEAYNSLVAYRKENPLPDDVYGENHHIKPKSIYPELKNDPDNIVRLSAGEHYKAHYYLMKTYENDSSKVIEWRKMSSAFWYMSNYIFTQRDLTPEELNDCADMYQKSREAIKKMYSEKYTGAGNPNYGKKASEETRRKLSEANKGKHHSEESKRKMSESLKGKRKGCHHTEETRKKISEKAKGRPSAFKGRHFTEEQRKTLSESCKGRIPWNKGLKGCQKMSDATKEKMSKKRKGMVAHNKGLRWFNNGKINRQSKECPEGFVSGKLRKAV